MILLSNIPPQLFSQTCIYAGHPFKDVFRQGCLKSASNVLQWSFKCVQSKFQGCFREVLRIVKSVSKAHPGSFQSVSRKLWGCVKENFKVWCTIKTFNINKENCNLKKVEFLEEKEVVWNMQLSQKKRESPNFQEKPPQLPKFQENNCGGTPKF